MRTLPPVGGITCNKDGCSVILSGLTGTNKPLQHKKKSVNWHCLTRFVELRQFIPAKDPSQNLKTLRTKQKKSNSHATGKGLW